MTFSLCIIPLLSDCAEEVLFRECYLNKQKTCSMRMLCNLKEVEEIKNTKTPYDSINSAILYSLNIPNQSTIISQ